MNPRDFVSPLLRLMLDIAPKAASMALSAAENLSDREEGVCQTDIANCKVTGLGRRGIVVA
jgi:hypothetical protein